MPQRPAASSEHSRASTDATISPRPAVGQPTPAQKLRLEARALADDIASVRRENVGVNANSRGNPGDLRALTRWYALRIIPARPASRAWEQTLAIQDDHVDRDPHHRGRQHGRSPPGRGRPRPDRHHHRRTSRRNRRRGGRVGRCVRRRDARARGDRQVPRGAGDPGARGHRRPRPPARRPEAQVVSDREAHASALEQLERQLASAAEAHTAALAQLRQDADGASARPSRPSPTSFARRSRAMGRLSRGPTHHPQRGIPRPACSRSPRHSRAWTMRRR